MDDKKLLLRTEDVNLLRKIYETMTQKGRNFSEIKYVASGQGELKGKTEAYHFQLYKNEYFTGVQLRKLDELLIKIIKPRNKSLVEPQSGLELIERLPTEKATGIDRAKFIFECFAEAKDISQPECLLEILELCEDNDLPLVAFENDRQGLKEAIADLRKYIADNQVKADLLQKVTDKLQLNSNSTLIPSTNIKIVTGEDKWLDPYNQDELAFVGRTQEIDLLNEFVSHEHQFKIWAIVGPSGAGKTRLAIHWAKKLTESKNWKCYLLHKEDRIKPKKWTKWSPREPTLIIIDYMFGFNKVIQYLIPQLQNQDQYANRPEKPKVRLLVIDHIFSETLYNDERWGFTGNQSSLNQIGDYFFKSEPLDLRQPMDQEIVIKSIIAHRAPNNIPITQINAAHKYLKKTQGAYQPLFAALLGDAMRCGQNFTKWNRRQLIDYYLSGSDRLPWHHEGKMGRWASCFVAVATARGDISYDDLIDVAKKFKSPPMHFDGVIKICQKTISDYDDDILSPLKPDILGESFFLKFLQFLKTSPAYQKEFRKIFLTGDEEKQTNDAVELIFFIQRLTLNLLTDDQSQKETKAMWNVLFKFMNPSYFEKSGPFSWALTVGLIDIIATIKNQISEEKISALLNQIEPAFLNFLNTKKFLNDSIGNFLRFVDLFHKSTESFPAFYTKIIELFNYYEENNTRVC